MTNKRNGKLAGEQSDLKQPPSLSEVNDNSENQVEDIQTTPSVEKVTKEFLRALKNIGLTVDVVFPHLSHWFIQELTKTKTKLESFAESNFNSDGKLVASVREFAEFKLNLKYSEELRNSKAMTLLSNSLFVQLFSEFDAFIGAFLKVIYLKNDELLKSISREIGFRDLLEHADVNSIKAVMLEKEIDSFRRESYVDQFSILEKKFSIVLKKFNEWPDFVELSQRRNIITHNGGMVSEQYLIVCEREGYTFEVKPKVGELIKIDLGYLFQAIVLLSKVGFMLSYTLWSKTSIKDRKEIQKSMNDVLYDCLHERRWETAAQLGEITLTENMRKDMSDIDLRIRVINVAIAHKFSGQEELCQKWLNSLDWSATYRDFKLAISVLEDNFQDAINIMESIGKAGEIIVQESYHSWPLFFKFRESSEFLNAYQKVYGESYFGQVSNEVSEIVEMGFDGITSNREDFLVLNTHASLTSKSKKDANKNKKLEDKSNKRVKVKVETPIVKKVKKIKRHEVKS